MKTEKKTNNHHHFEIATTQEQIATTLKQMDLNGKKKIQINQKYKLSINQMKLMETFYLNPNSEVSPVMLFKSWGNEMHENAIHRFIKRAKINMWIIELQVIPGVTINNLFAFYKEPNRLETGKIIKDNRCKYYQITKLGKKIFEVNEKLK